MNLLVYSLSGSKKGKEKEGTAFTLENPIIIEPPKLPGGETGTFRVAKCVVILSLLFHLYLIEKQRYHPHNSRVFYTVMNTTPTRGGKPTQRKAYIIRWNTDGWKAERIRKVGAKGLTVFDLRFVFLQRVSLIGI